MLLYWILGFVIGFGAVGLGAGLGFLLGPKPEKEESTIAQKCNCKKCEHCDCIDKDGLIVGCSIRGRTCMKKQCKYYEKGIK